MKLINISTRHIVQQLRYEYDDDMGVFSFENDIAVKPWTVSRFIKLCGPRYSVYKYDYKNYLEFVITDVNGESGVIKWFYNVGDENLKASPNRNDVVDVLPFFFAEHPIFLATDWEDYENARILKAIDDTIQDSSLSSDVKISRIAVIIKRKLDK